MTLENKLNSQNSSKGKRAAKIAGSAVVGAAAAYYSTELTIDNLADIINTFPTDIAREFPRSIYNALKENKDLICNGSIVSGGLSWGAIATYLTKPKESNVIDYSQTSFSPEQIARFQEIDARAEEDSLSKMDYVRSISFSTIGAIGGYLISDNIFTETQLFHDAVKEGLIPSFVGSLSNLGTAITGHLAGSKLNEILLIRKIEKDFNKRRQAK
jgi:hypothetical protein